MRLVCYSHVFVSIFLFHLITNFAVLVGTRSNLIITKVIYREKHTHNKQHFRYIALILCCAAHTENLILWSKRIDRSWANMVDASATKHHWYLYRFLFNWTSLFFERSLFILLLQHEEHFYFVIHPFHLSGIKSSATTHKND